MSLSSSHKPVTLSRGLPVRMVMALVVTIAVAVAAAALVRVSPGTSEASLVSTRPGHAKFLELNTTALPPAPSAVEAVPERAVSLDRFVEINTTGMPSLADTNTENVSDGFLYWNVDSFERAGSANGAVDEGASAVTPVSGPR
jgi:hypothetical protein